MQISDMATKGTKDSLAHKLGFKSGSRSADQDLERMKRENQQLKKNLDEMKRTVRHKHSSSQPDPNKLLEKILSLETLMEKNCQQLLGKEQEISDLRMRLQATHGDVVTALNTQLEEKKQEFERKERMFLALSKEAEDLKNKYCAVVEKCETLEKQKTTLQVSSSGSLVLQEQLRDALEKNQQWLVYDQQREAYVQSILARNKDLESKLANQTCETKLKEHCPDAKGQLDQELEAVRAHASRIQADLDDLKERFEVKSNDAAEAREQLLDERKISRNALQEERKCSAERAARLQVDLEAARAALEEERNRGAELLQQVNVLQMSLLKLQEQQRVTVLEQQVQESEMEKIERQTLQHQLHKVLKELRKARDQIARLESKQQREARLSEPCPFNRMDFESPLVRVPSASKGHNILDESVLECPNCGETYPTSQHRELLAHLDYCFT